jgi:hypothetical protein
MSDENKEKETKKKPPLVKETKPVGKVIYLGPPIMERDKTGSTTFQISYGAIFSNGLPDDVKVRIAEDVSFSKMFIPVEKAAVSMKELMNKDSDLFAAKKKVGENYLNRRKSGGR